MRAAPDRTPGGGPEAGDRGRGRRSVEGVSMQIQPFALERWQSEWENLVKHNLSESGVHRMSVQELLGPGQVDELLSQGLSYGYSNGSDALRAAITAQYPGAKPEQVVVTNGSAEANFISAWRVV